jgi:hypothetical protein
VGARDRAGLHRYRALAQRRRDPREVLAELPVTDKLDIKRSPDRYVSRALPPSARLETHTGGSTRHPMRFFLQKHVTRPKEYAFMQDFRARVGVGEEDLVLALRGRTVPTAAEPDGRLWMLEPDPPAASSFRATTSSAATCRATPRRSRSIAPPGSRRSRPRSIRSPRWLSRTRCPSSRRTSAA